MAEFDRANPIGLPGDTGSGLRTSCKPHAALQGIQGLGFNGLDMCADCHQTERSRKEFIRPVLTCYRRKSIPQSTWVELWCFDPGWRDLGAETVLTSNVM